MFEPGSILEAVWRLSADNARYLEMNDGYHWQRAADSEFEHLVGNKC
jgi:hypothetical protein